MVETSCAHTVQWKRGIKEFHDNSHPLLLLDVFVCLRLDSWFDATCCNPFSSFSC